MTKRTNKELGPEERELLVQTLRTRFEQNMNRHKRVKWADVQARLEANPGKLWSLQQMEVTGGEPDVVDVERDGNGAAFYDCSVQTPKGRTSVCYDREGLESRKEHKPANTVMDMAEAMGIELLTEAQYFELQKFAEFDTKTSSWVKTPENIRELGGALYCERRYGRIFTGHNGAQSYYNSRGFRGRIEL